MPQALEEIYSDAEGKYIENIKGISWSETSAT